MKKITSLLTLLALASMASAKVWMPQLFQNGMVLQRSQPIPVWGTAEKGETVTVTFQKKSYTATAGDDGKWRIDLPKQKAGGPYTMTIADTKDVTTLENVLIGDVWVVSGQSNVDIHLERVYPQYGKLLDDYQNDKIRLFRVFTNTSTERRNDVARTAWKDLNKDNAWHFSALGYFLGKRMYETHGVPQGVIQTSQGGTDIQAWMDIDSLRTYPGNYYTNYLLYTDKEYVDAQTRANNRAGDVWLNAMNQTDPGYQKFEKEDLDDSQWPVHSQYANNEWARVGGRPVCGSMWLRQHITVDAKHAGMAATLNLGTFHDMDYTFVNGKQVGVTYYQYPPRRYQIPAGLLHEGDNVITIRLICKTGMANFYKNKPHNLTYENGDVQETSFDWRHHIGSVMPSGPLGGKLNTQNQASMLYNAMLYPLAPYAVSGFVWYQGENNADRAGEYGTMLQKLTGNWRTLWNRPDMPFCIVQLANYMEPSAKPQDTGWSQLREKQRLFTDGDPHSSLVVAIDLGEASDIHPLKKQDVADRCALVFDNVVFGKKNTLFPQPVTATLKDATVTITMTEALRPCDTLQEFEVRGADGKFISTTASTDGKTVTVTVPAGTTATAVRYAWKNNPDKVNLYSKAGLPASPFQINL